MSEIKNNAIEKAENVTTKNAKSGNSSKKKNYKKQAKERALKHIEAMQKCENMYLDLSGGGTFRYGLVRYLCDKVGAERVVFGTDYPICNLKMYVGAVMGERLTQRERELIFAENAKRLLELK